MREIQCDNQAVMAMLWAQRRRDGQIAEGVYVAAQYVCDTGRLVHLWIGHRDAGPTLAYHPDEGWSPIYSRGDYGRNYSHGGHWSVHCRNLHAALTTWPPARGDVRSDLLVCGEHIARLPDESGITPDIVATDIDCSGSWASWYRTAAEAMAGRLTPEQIQESTLPPKTKTHLASAGESAMSAVREVCAAFGI